MRKINQKIEAASATWKSHKQACAGCARSTNRTRYLNDMCHTGTLLFKTFCLAVDDDLQNETRQRASYIEKRRQRTTSSKHSQN